MLHDVDFVFGSEAAEHGLRAQKQISGIIQAQLVLSVPVSPRALKVEIVLVLEGAMGISTKPVS